MYFPKGLIGFFSDKVQQIRKKASNPKTKAEEVTVWRRCIEPNNWKAQFKNWLVETKCSLFLKPDHHPLIDTRHNVLLYVEGVNKSFDGFKAINDLNLYIKEGELRCIIGPNGAGKTTMMDIITGKNEARHRASLVGL